VLLGDPEFQLSLLSVTSWSGSRVAIVERRLQLFVPYLTDAEVRVAAWACELDSTISQCADQLRQGEQQEHRQSLGPVII
jgi:hypothetical protein